MFFVQKATDNQFLQYQYKTNNFGEQILIIFKIRTYTKKVSLLHKNSSLFSDKNFLTVTSNSFFLQMQNRS